MVSSLRLDIGAGTGDFLVVAKNDGWQTTGIEPSAKAVADGNKRYKKIKMIRGVATDLPLKGKFDLVIVNFVLHWIPREKFFLALAEIDRMVADLEPGCA